MREFLMSLAVDFGTAWVTPWLYLEVRQVFALVLAVGVCLGAAYLIYCAVYWLLRPLRS